MTTQENLPLKQRLQLVLIQYIDT